MADEAARILHALADLTPSPRDQAGGAATVPTEWFTWLPLTAQVLFGVNGFGVTPTSPVRFEEPHAVETLTRFVLAVPTGTPSLPIDRDLGNRLAAVDQIRPDQRSLRVGWLFVAGRRLRPDGRPERVLHPLVTVPVKVDRLVASASLRTAGDVELSPLVDDPLVRSQPLAFGGGGLSGEVAPPEILRRMPKLQAFAHLVAESAGFETVGLVPAGQSPEELMRRDDLVIVAGMAVYATHEVGGTGRAATLRSLAAKRLDDWTALHSVYLGAPESPARDDAPVESPYPLTPSQREAVRRARRDAVTVVSGAPGTGKSQTVTAIACDAVARGSSVLVTAKSEATVDALIELFERAPGPDPVVFGSNERRDALAARLAGGGIDAALVTVLEAADAARRAALSQREALRRQMADRLVAELIRSGRFTDPLGVRAAAPGLFDGADLDEATRLATAAQAPVSGWWDRRRCGKAERALRRLAGAPDATSLGLLLEALEVARATRGSSQLWIDTPDGAASRWRALAVADGTARRRVGEWMAVEAIGPDRINDRVRPRLAALGTALRAGRAARRTQLERLSKTDLTRALPVWVGTLGDIDDLLPPTPAMFDLVILDEASSIDQALAAPALLRGARAVIVGDPKQLRHVSFVSDEQIAEALTGCGIDPASPLGLRLDVRRNSAFDLGAGAASVLALDEHFRSVPPLVQLVFDRLYDGRVRVATRTPASEAEQCIDAVTVDGVRGRDKVVDAEVDRVLSLLHKLHAAGEDSVAVMSPMRAQADAIEARVLAKLTIDELEDLDLRVGTVHGMQGNERDTVVVSLGVDGGSAAQSWRFVEDPHLLAVMLTRARERATFVHAADPPTDGLLAAYLAQATTSTPAPTRSNRRRRRSEVDVDPWSADLAAQLRIAGLEVAERYEVGRHTVDLCVGDASAFVGVVTGVHPAGPDAHIERQLDLLRAGWRLFEAFPGAWEDRRGELVVELVRLAAALGVRVSASGP